MSSTVLSGIPPFADLSEDGHARVAAGATELTVEPGQILTLHGDMQGKGFEPLKAR